MANVDYFLKIEGIPGETKDTQHPGEIDLETFSWSESQTAGTGAGGGGGAGKVAMQSFQCSMRISKASPNLFLGCASGKHFKTAIVSVRRPGPNAFDFLRWTMTDVLLTSYQIAGVETGDGIPRDQVGISFAKIQVEYLEQRPDGTPGPVTKAGWDQAANATF